METPEEKTPKKTTRKKRTTKKKTEAPKTDPTGVTAEDIQKTTQPKPTRQDIQSQISRQLSGAKRPKVAPITRSTSGSTNRRTGCRSCGKRG